MQYILTGIVILIISALLINAASMVVESVYKTLKGMQFKKKHF